MATGGWALARLSSLARASPPPHRPPSPSARVIKKHLCFSSGCTSREPLPPCRAPVVPPAPRAAPALLQVPPRVRAGTPRPACLRPCCRMAGAPAELGSRDLPLDGPPCQHSGLCQLSHKRTACIPMKINGWNKLY